MARPTALLHGEFIKTRGYGARWCDIRAGCAGSWRVGMRKLFAVLTSIPISGDTAPRLTRRRLVSKEGLGVICDCRCKRDPILGCMRCVRFCCGAWNEHLQSPHQTRCIQRIPGLHDDIARGRCHPLKSGVGMVRWNLQRLCSSDPLEHGTAVNTVDKLPSCGREREALRVIVDM